MEIDVIAEFGPVFSYTVMEFCFPVATTMTMPNESPGERPRHEPEILPPSRPSDGPSQSSGAMFTRMTREFIGIRVTRVGPLSLAIIFVSGVLIAICLLFLIAGAFLISLGVATVAAVASIALTMIRGSSRR